MRIKGYYLAVATLAAQFFFDWLFIRIPWFTGYAPSGSVSAPPLALFGLELDSRGGRYLFCLGFVCVIALAAKNIVRGRIGRMWMAIRDMDIAAEIIGISPLRGKAVGVRRQLVHHRHRRGACGHSSISARGSRSPSRSTARSSCCS